LTGGFNTGVSKTSSTLSSSGHDFSLSFEYDISTSTDPNLAGHASDIIIGGGIDLIVTEGKMGIHKNIFTNLHFIIICIDSYFKC
jgi:hypothetical protein